MPATPLRPGSHHLAGFQRRGGCRELRTYLVRPLEVPRRSSKGREHCHVGHDEAFDTLEDPSTGDPDRTNGAAIEEDDDDRSKLAAKKLRVTALREALPSDQARSQFLSASRREMYDSLGLFHAHVKSAISLMFGIITAVLAVVGFVIEKNSSPPVLTLVLNAAPVVLALIFPFSIVSILVIGRYYKPRPHKSADLVERRVPRDFARCILGKVLQEDLIQVILPAIANDRQQAAIMQNSHELAYRGWLVEQVKGE